MKKQQRNLVADGLARALSMYVEDDDIEALEIETEFWLSVEDCELCDGQMCSAHYERMYATL